MMKTGPPLSPFIRRLILSKHHHYCATDAPLDLTQEETRIYHQVMCGDCIASVVKFQVNEWAIGMDEE